MPHIELNHLTQLRARATGNMVAVAPTNYAPPDANGHSIAFDPVAFTGQGSRDTMSEEIQGRSVSQ